MKYSVIVIGDELLIGQVADTNSGWIARHLSPFGWEASNFIVISDDRDEIISSVNDALAKVDIVLVTGGLGPTKDDITKSALCEYFGGEMVYDEETASNVLDVVNKRHIKMNEYTRLQAMVPTSCKVVQNRVGTAPIMWFEKDGKVLVSMPGVPHEMQTMMQMSVIPLLLKHFYSDNYCITHKTFIVRGIIESELAMRLDEFEKHLPTNLHLAYLPQGGWIRLRLSGHGTDNAELDRQMSTASNDLRSQIAEYIICDEDKTLQEILGDKLLKSGLTLSTAESCTGGNIAHLITSISGSSRYFTGAVVCYDTMVKVNQLRVPQDIINEYTVVSKPVAEYMVQGVSKLMCTDCAIATTGYAGPGGGTPGKPVGTVCIAVKCKDKVISYERHFPGTRDRVISRATTEAILFLIDLIY